MDDLQQLRQLFLLVSLVWISISFLAILMLVRASRRNAERTAEYERTRNDLINEIMVEQQRLIRLRANPRQADESDYESFGLRRSS